MNRSPMRPNHPAAGNAGTLLLCAVGRHLPGVPEPGRPKCPRKRGASGSHLGVFLFICLPCSHRLGPFVMAPLATDKSGRIESREQREDWQD